MSYPHRNMCQVLDEMRNCHKYLNFGPMAGLIEEVQIMGNKMEAALWDKKDLYAARKEATRVEKEVRKLERQRDKLKKK